MDRRHVMLGGLLAAGLHAGGARGSQPSRGRPAMPQAATGGSDEVVELWPDGAPGRLDPALREELRERSTDPAMHDRALVGISRPRMAVFRPRRPNGAAVLIAPGGGYSWVVVDKEGYELAPILAEAGVTVFVLFYRLPAEGWRSGPDTPLADAQRAMRLIRHRATGYGVDPARVAAMGFSAGGHLCADLAARWAAAAYDGRDAADRLSPRPFLAAPIYPVVSMYAPEAHAGSRRNLIGASPSASAQALHSPHRNLGAQTPPLFLVHAEDDTVVPSANSLLLRDAARAAGIPVETHLFAVGGHGFGTRRIAGKPGAVWPQLFLSWARSQGLFG